jgi:hypothetical protein
MSVKIRKAGRGDRSTDERGLDIAPRLFAPPQLSGAGDALALSVRCFPRVLPKQRVEIFVSSQPFATRPFAQETDAVTASIRGVAPSDVPVPVLLRVDGVGSLAVRDRSAQPPQFDPQQLVTLPI